MRKKLDRQIRPPSLTKRDIPFGPGCIAAISYVLCDDDGSTLDTATAGDPLVFLHGVGAVPAPLEKALIGATRYDRRRVEIDPMDGHGPHLPELVVTLPRNQAPAGVLAGQWLRIDEVGGAVRHGRVIRIDPHEITIDANAPLAGVTMTVDALVVAVRPATSQEQAAGMVMPVEDWP